MAYSAQQIVSLVNSGKGPADLFSGSDDANAMGTLHQEISDEMLQLQGAMSQHWVGDAAGQAYTGASPMVQASQVSGEHLNQAQNLYTGQGSSFGDLQWKVMVVGDLGDRPAGDWVSGTPLSFLSNRSAEIKQWDQKAQQVVTDYSVYHGQSTDNSGRWPQQYGEVGLPPSGADIQPTADPSGPGQPGGPRHPGEPGGHPRTGTGSSGSPIPGGGLPPTGGGPGQPNPSSPTPGPTGPSQSTGTAPAGHAPSGPPAPGVMPPGVPGPGIGNNDFGGGPIGFGPGSGTGFGPGSGYGGRDGGVGARGPGSGVGSPGSGNLGGGKSSGVGAFGEPHAGSRVSGGAGTPGRPGAPGMGGAGAAGRKGEGDEDLEHQRPAYLLEDDPDAALVGELPRTTPPVIGL